MSETISTPVPGADDDARWAGRVDFPRGPADLRSVTTCPACHAPLRSALCSVCALDLRHPDAAELAALSARAADLLDARRALIGRLRRDAAAASRAHAAPAAVPSVPLAPVAHAAAAPPAPVAHAGPAIPTAAAAHTAPLVASAPSRTTTPPGAPGAPQRPMPSAPRSGRSGIQVALLVVGVSLLSIFAIFWLAYAFLVYGSTVRMLIIAGGTLATLAAAAALSRRGLTATAEGIAVLGTIILVLDAWALRANDPVGIGSVDGPLYWGVALLVVAAVAIAWSRLGRLSSPAVGAALVLPLGAALVTGHLADAGRLDAQAVAVTAGLAAFLVALAHPVIAPADRPRLAGVVALTALAAAAPGALLALGAGIGGGLGQSGADALPLVTGIGLALVSALHVLLAPRASGEPVVAAGIAVAAAAGGTLALLAGIVASILQNEGRPLTTAGALLVVVTVAVLLSLVPSRPARVLDAARVAAVASAAVVAAAAAAVTLVTALSPALEAVLAVATPVDDVTSPLQTATDAELAALGGAAATLALIALGGRLGGPLRPVVPFTLPGLGALLVAATPLAGPWWLALALAVLLAIGGAAGVSRARGLASGPPRTALLVTLGIVAVGGSVIALVVAPRVESAWIIGTAAALLAITLGRRVAPQTPAALAALVAAVVLVLAAAPALGSDLVRAGVSVSLPGVLLILAALLVIAVPLGRLDEVEQRATALLAGVAGLGAAALMLDVGSGGRNAVSDGLAIALGVAALSLLVLRSRDAALRVPAAALLGPAVVGLVLVALRIVVASSREPATIAGIALWGPIAALGALLLVTAVALATLERGAASGRVEEHRSLRFAVDGGVVVSGAWMLSLAIERDVAVLGLLLAAVVVLLIALSGDGLIGARSRRRHLGWIALALGTSALWTGLADESIADPEGYALPLAGALLLIAAALARHGAARGTPARSAAPLIGAALALALLPVALLSGIGAGTPTLRSAVVGLAALALLGVAVARTERLESRIPTLPIVLAGVSLTALGVVSGALVIDLIATVATPLELQLRGLLVVVVLAGAAVAVRVLATAAMRDPVAGILLGFSALAAAVLGIAGTVAPVELIALPVALAALALGVLELDRRPGTSSWPLLAPGLLLLLAPSLIAIAGEPEPWRIVALGVVSAGVMLGGVQQRLQAPFVLGGSVLLVHALVQSWPLLSRAAAAVDWWIWLGIVGILVVAVAARYERRVQNLTAIARRIADLR